MKARYLIIICILLAAAALAPGCGGDDAQVAQDGDLVSVHYTLTLEDGTEVAETSEGGDPLSFTLGDGELITGFEDAVRGMKVGEVKTVTLPPEEAYGPYYEELLIQYSWDELPEDMQDAQVGDWVTLTTQSGTTAYRQIVEVTDEYIVVDTNYELAGQTLTFEIELISIDS